MLERLSLDALRAAPHTVEERGRALLGEVRAAPERARSWAHDRRENGAARLWRARVSTLEATADLLSRTTEVPVVARVTSPAHQGLVARAQSLRAPLAGYADMNAREAIAAVRDMSLVDVLRAEHWETSHKNRKTVLAALRRALGETASVAS